MLSSLVNDELSLSMSEQDGFVHYQADPTSKVVLLAGPFSSFWSPTCFVKLVGSGLLGTAVVPFKADILDEDSYGFRPDQFEAALRSCGANKETSTLEIHPNWALRDPPLGFFSLDSILSSDQDGAKLAKLTVCDDAGFVKAAQVGPCASEAGRAGGAGTVLVMKICGALAAMGYGLPEVERVSKLVEKNVVSMNVMQTGDGFSNDQQSDLIATALTTMLGRGDKDQGFLRVNSNEPVLLINNLGGLSPADMRSITEHVMRQLHDEWSIWPVRIYTGSYMESRKDTGFSISILNVVNTDIGGPSMIQLLDATCDAQGWRSFVRKETWNGREMLAREDGAEPVSVEAETTARPIESTTPYVATADEEHEEHEEHAKAPVPEAEIALQKNLVAQGECHTDVTEAEADISTSSINKSEVTEVQQAEEPGSPPATPSFVLEEPRPLPDILHPTWKHDEGSESLLDMIKRQAQRLSLTSRETTREPEESSQQVAHSAAQIEPSGEDEPDVERSDTSSPIPVVEGSEMSSEGEFEVI